jgi:uncharacterized protein YbjT (DUF2867 family)
MHVVVTGGTGVVGSQVVRELVARGADVSVVTRDPGKAKLPAGVQALQGNLGEPASVRRVFQGADAVFLLNIVSPTESHEGFLPVTALRETKPKRLVYLSVHHAEKAAWLPHFGTKVGIEEAIKRSGLPFTIVRPNNFYQNDYWFKDVLLNYGIYPQPIGSTGISRVDVRDIAEASAIALLTSGHEGQTYDLVGPDLCTGAWTAKIWSNALGKEITYGGDDLDAWEKQALTYLPDWAAFDFRHMYAFFQEQGLKASPEAITRQTTLLGHAPRSFEAFAKETAAAWKA